MMNVFSALLRPGRMLISRMRFASRMALIGGVFAGPILILLWTLYVTQENQIQFTGKERVGLQLIQNARQILQILHTESGEALPGAYHAVEPREATISPTFTGAVLQANRNADQIYGDVLGTRTKWAEILSDWQSLEIKASAMTPDSSVGKLGDLESKIDDYITQVADNSNLTLDVDIDSYYLMAQATVHIPAALKAADKLRSIAFTIAKEEAITASQRLALEIQLNSLEVQMTAIRAGFVKARTQSPELQRTIGTLLDQFEKNKLVAASLVRGNILDTPSINIDAAQVLGKYASLIDSGYAVFDAIMPQIDRLLAQRIEHLHYTLLKQYLLVLCCFMFVMYFALAAYSSVIESVDGILRGARRIADGDFSRMITVRSRDEIGSLAIALNEVQIRLGQEIEEERRLFEENVAIGTQLKTANDVLEQRVLERTRQIQEAHEELRQAMQHLIESEKLASLGRIVAGVAHELNTPIGNLRTVASTLAEKNNELEPKARAGALTRSALHEYIVASNEASNLIERNVARAAFLIDSFKEVSIDQTSLRKESFELLNLASNLFRLMEIPHRLDKRKINIDVPQDLIMDSYPGHMEQILMILIQNTIQHGFEGKNEDDGEITLSARALKNGVQIDYRDNGIGVTPEISKRMFDPFFTTKFGQGRPGLGLYIFHNLVTSVFHGRIEPVDACTTGFHLCFSLPASTG